MKTIILLMFPILAVSNTLSAQTKFNRFQFKDMNSDNTFSYSQHVICPIEKFKLNEMADLFADKKTKQDFGLRQKQFHLYLKKNFPSYESLRAEKYPGSSRFYAKRPYLSSSPIDKAFIIKPDPNTKYYLIIKDPITNKIIN